MFDRFRKSSPEIVPEPLVVPDAERSLSPNRFLIDIVTDFDGTVRRRLGDEVADEYARKQKEVADKAHRTPPDSLRNMRF